MSIQREQRIETILERECGEPVRDRVAGPRRRGVLAGSALLALLLATPSSALPAGSPGGAVKGILRPVPPEPAAGEAVTRVVQGERREVQQHTHTVFEFGQDIQRVAVGDETFLDVKLLNTREFLALGLKPGTTNVLVWFAGGTLESIEVTITEDLRLLEAVLEDIHPGIRVQKTPGREALVLTGTVPRPIYARRAEEIAHSWLDFSSGHTELLVGEVAEEIADSQSVSIAERGDRGQRRSQQYGVINLIRVDGLPEFALGVEPEELIREAIAPIGGEKVTIRRVQKGTAPDDEVDILVLEGEVPDQITLVRVLSLAYKVYIGRRKGPSISVTDGVSQTTQVFEGDYLAISKDLEVIADEGGALFESRASAKQGDQGATDILRGFGSTTGRSTQGGTRQMELENRVGANIARASAIELAGGQILSFIEVADLPQVRVDIRVYEVNRTKLLAFGSDLGLQTSDFDQPGLEPAVGATTLQGSSAARVGAQGGQDIQNVFGFLGGTISNQLQISGSSWAVDSLLGYLENEGIARSLANPSLAVLSGEYAVFEVGGQVPVEEFFATDLGTQGILGRTRYIDYGINLAVRPLVGKDDYITIDFAPEVSTPDAQLTQLLVEATGKNPGTFALESRLLKTSSRLLDGQTLLVGGLAQTERSDENKQAPWLSKLPLLGLLFQGFDYSDDDLEVVVMVRPTIVRDPIPDAGLWAYPGGCELLASALPERPAPPAPAELHPEPEPEPAVEPVESEDDAPIAETGDDERVGGVVR